MVWYFDIIAMVALFIVGNLFLIKDTKKRMAIPMKTKDGYSVGIAQMDKIEEKRTFPESTSSGESLRYLKQSLYSSEDLEGNMAAITVVAGFCYLTFGNALNFFLGVPNEVVGGLAIVIILYSSLLTNKKSISKIAELIEQLYIETPSDFKEYGQFVKNPFDVLTTLKTLKSEEENWEKMKTRRDNEERELELKVKKREMEPNARRDESIEWDIDNLKWSESKLVDIGNKVLVETGLLTNNLLTDQPPESIREILDANKTSIKNTNSDAHSKSEGVAPHYIEVMKKIALNPKLPPEVTDEAKAIINAYQEKAEDKELQETIDNALLEINTVKKFMIK